MRVYFDTCSLMRPFDDQSFPRVRLETLAISDVMDFVQSGKIQWIAGRALYSEVSACPIYARREEVLSWLRNVSEWQEYTPIVARLAKRFAKYNIGDWDARHLATAEAAQCDWFLSTDQNLVKRAQKVSPKLSVRVANPAEFILEDIA